MQNKVTGVVLAGGLSTRMGRDKALLSWGDTDFLHIVLNKLAPVCAELIVVSNLPRRLDPAVRVVPDLFLQCGPLAGIHAGLTAAANEYIFVAACDMPFLNTEAAAYMIAAGQAYDAAVPRVDGRLHPLHGLYRQTCLPVAAAMLEQGRFKVAELLYQIKLREISETEITRFDRELKTLKNINTEDDYKRSR